MASKKKQNADDENRQRRKQAGEGSSQVKEAGRQTGRKQVAELLKEAGRQEGRFAKMSS